MDWFVLGLFAVAGFMAGILTAEVGRVKAEKEKKLKTYYYDGYGKKWQLTRRGVLGVAVYREYDGTTEWTWDNFFARFPEAIIPETPHRKAFLEVQHEQSAALTEIDSETVTLNG